MGCTPIQDGEVQNQTDPSYEYINSRILIEAKQKEAVEKQVLLCEDDLARLWANNLMNGSENKRWCEAQGNNIGDGTINILAKSGLKCFSKLIFIIDGDGCQNPNFKKHKNIIFLPGDRPPETIFYTFLKGLSENDDFWGGAIFFIETLASRILLLQLV